MQYRNDWVHNERPAVDGLDLDVTFGPLRESDLPAEMLRKLGLRANGKRKAMTMRVGLNIDKLRDNARRAYHYLLGSYEGLGVAGLLA